MCVTFVQFACCWFVPVLLHPQHTDTGMLLHSTAPRAPCNVKDFAAMAWMTAGVSEMDMGEEKHVGDDGLPDFEDVFAADQHVGFWRNQCM